MKNKKDNKLPVPDSNKWVSTMWMRHPTITITQEMLDRALRGEEPLKIHIQAQVIGIRPDED